MTLSSKTQNGLKILLHVAEEAQYGRLAQGKEIALKRRINEPYIEQIMISLKLGGLIRTVRGRNGGYTLAKAPEEISLLDIIRACEGEIDFSQSEFTPKNAVSDSQNDGIKCILKELSAKFCTITAEISLSSILTQCNVNFPDYVI